MDQADIMREKQRRADLKKQGIDPDADQEKPKKVYDTSFMDKYQYDYGEEEEKKEEDEFDQAAAQMQGAAAAG